MGYQSVEAMPYWKIAPLREELFEGHPSVELDPRIAAAKPDLVITKTAPSIFFNTPVAQFLVKQRVDTVIVTGCITSGCVRASVIDAFSLGFRTIVPEDCVGDHEEEPHRANLREASLVEANLNSADIRSASFRAADLSGATLPNGQRYKDPADLEQFGAASSRKKSPLPPQED